MLKGWIKAALLKGELRITENNNCPFHNPEHRIDIETMLNACEKHKWASKIWYEEWKESL
jgi:hypothetical protein